MVVVGGAGGRKPAHVTSKVCSCAGTVRLVQSFRKGKQHRKLTSTGTRRGMHAFTLRVRHMLAHSEGRSLPPTHLTLPNSNT